MGFREPLIRFYNQILFDFFKKSYNSDIIVGKDHWLYFIQHVNEYYGKEIFRWYDSNDAAVETFDRQARMMYNLRTILNENGVEFLVFMAPQKGFLYPEHLPEREKDTTTVSAREFYSAKFDEYGIPYIEMTKWFIGMKEADTVPFSLFPNTGAHWGFSAAYATDSLFRFMADLKGLNMHELQFGSLHETTDSAILATDHDIESLLNLCRPLPHPGERLYEADVTVVPDSTAVRPRAIFIGTSFLRRMHYFVPFNEVFTDPEYWYYNSKLYYGKDFRTMTMVSEVDVLQHLLDADFVVWFTEGDQMCKASFGFVENALINLCLSEKRVDEMRKHVIDSLRHDSLMMIELEGRDSLKQQSKLWNKANWLVTRFPYNYFPELAGDSVPTTRNPRLPEALAIRDIKRDSAWMKNMKCQTIIQNATLEEVLKMEAQNILNGRPLMRDMTGVDMQSIYIESFVKETKEDILTKPNLMESIRQKAVEKGITFEEQLEADARWIVNDKIKRGLIVL